MMFQQHLQNWPPLAVHPLDLQSLPFKQALVIGDKFRQALERLSVSNVSFFADVIFERPALIGFTGFGDDTKD